MMKDYHGKCHTKECKDNLLITNYNQTLETFNTLIQCMFSEYSGSLNGRNAYDKEPWSQRFLLWIFFLLNGYKFIYNKEEIPSEGETSGNNCLQPHFHAVKF